MKHVFQCVNLGASNTGRCHGAAGGVDPPTGRSRRGVLCDDVIVQEAPLPGVSKTKVQFLLG